VNLSDKRAHHPLFALFTEKIYLPAAPPALKNIFLRGCLEKNIIV